MEVVSVNKYGDRFLVIYKVLAHCGCYWLRRTVWSASDNTETVTEAVIEQNLKYEDINKR